MFIEKYLDEDFMIWIDTCSVLHEQFQVFIDSISIKLLPKKSAIYITSSVYNELEKHAVSGDNDLKIKASKALSVVNWCLGNGTMVVYNQKSKHYFADNDFLTIFTGLRIAHNLLLITQDKNLCSDVWALEKSKSVNSKKIRVAKINMAGGLELFKLDGYGKNKSCGKSQWNGFDFLGILNKDIEGDINGDVLGVITGDVEGNINGDVEGDINGDVLGVITGDIEGRIKGRIYKG